MYQRVLIGLVFFLACPCFAAKPEPLVFHWKQSEVHTAAITQAINTILRSYQQNPVVLKERLKIHLFARAHREGKLKISLDINNLTHHSGIEQCEQGDSYCEWNLPAGGQIRATITGSKLQQVLISRTTTSSNTSTLQILPACHEVPIDASDLQWLEELTIYISVPGTWTPVDRVHVHLMHLSGQKFCCSPPNRTRTRFRPGFFSIYCPGNKPGTERILTPDFARQLLDREMADLNLQLKALTGNEPPATTCSLNEYIPDPMETASLPSMEEMKQQLQPALDLANHGMEFTSPGSRPWHRYFTSLPVYSMISTLATCVSQTKNKNLRVDSWGSFIEKPDKLRRRLETDLSCLLTASDSDLHNQNLADQTYAALILDTDPRPALRGQLGLFARYHLDKYTCLGAYGGLLCHHKEQKALERFYGQGVADYIHDTGPSRTNRLIISPYQTGNLLSLVNTDRLREHQPDPKHPRNLNRIGVRYNGISYIVFATSEHIPAHTELLSDYGGVIQSALQQGSDHEIPPDNSDDFDDSASIISISSTQSETGYEAMELGEGSETGSEESSSRPQTLIKSKQSRTDSRRRLNYTCEQCDRRYSPYEIIYHMLAFHNEPAFICPVVHCLSVFKVSEFDKYLEHIKQARDEHTRKNNHLCEQPDCHYGSPRLDLLQKHCSQPHRKRSVYSLPFRRDCKILQSWNLHWTQLGKGIRSAYICPVCSATFDGGQKLAFHITSVHATPCLFCPVKGCTSVFSSYDYWFYHVLMIKRVAQGLGLKVCEDKLCHHIYSRPEVPHSCLESIAPELLPASCPTHQCPEEFSSADAITEHVHLRRTATGDTLHCPNKYCHIRTKVQSRLDRHLGSKGVCPSSPRVFQAIPHHLYNITPRLLRTHTSQDILRGLKRGQPKKIATEKAEMTSGKKTTKKGRLTKKRGTKRHK
ncbi:hypothetical protein ACWJJH_00745 [Endozoicomonadaceae bacterium StTr2]